MQTFIRIITVAEVNRQPEKRQTQNGKTFLKVPLHVSEEVTYPGAAKPYPRKAWIDAVLWGKAAEMHSNLKAGDLVCVEGSITTRSWEDKTTGKKNYVQEISVSSLTVLDKPDFDAQSMLDVASDEDLPF